MIVGHRWERDEAMRQYKCVGLPIGGVESGQWCVGCGVVVTDTEYSASRLPVSHKMLQRETYLDAIASRKGYEPIEHGTLRWIIWEGKRKAKPPNPS